ncbi:hypothetical protein HYU13_03465 [Candidatus Woesearchaeota archaeon]|nr:hypothetical protein [Candidatus Woesearchaeota archaeon]
MEAKIEQVFEELANIRNDIRELKSCFHEDFLELSEKAKSDIEESRKELRSGKRIPFNEVLRKAGMD